MTFHMRLDIVGYLIIIFFVFWEKYFNCEHSLLVNLAWLIDHS